MDTTAIIEIGKKVLAALNNGFGHTLLAVIIIICSIITERLARRFIHASFEKSSKIIKVDHTQYALLKHFISAIIYLVGIGVAIYLIPALKALAISLFAGAGLLAIIVGFASQKAFSNIVSGIFIAIFKPFRVGDIIKIESNTGTVEDITLRHTVIKNFENKRFIIPNSVISDVTIENYNIGDSKICKWFEIGISYDSDLDKAMKIIEKAALNHPECLDNRTKEDKKNNVAQVPVRVVGFGDSSVNLKAWIWTKDPPTAFKLGCDLNKKVKQEFDKHSIEIPFPYRTIIYKKEKKSKRVKKKN